MKKFNIITNLGLILATLAILVGPFSPTVYAAVKKFIQGGNSFGTSAILGTNDNFDLTFETNNIERARISTAGNVGIGTSNPEAKLNVVGGEFWLFNEGQNPRIILGDSGTSGQYGFAQWDSLNDYYRIETDGTNGLKIKGNNVSIGNIFPSEPLIVGLGTVELFRVNSSGNASISGNLTATSLISTADSIINSLNIGLGGGSVFTNTAVGKDALLGANSNSFSNTAVGYRALSNAGSSGDSTAVGYLALVSSITGSDANTAVGTSALRDNTTGRFNTAVGGSLVFNTTGERNVAIGNSALNNNNGNRNIAIGWRSGMLQADGSALTTPERSIYIGNEARGFDDNDFNSIVIGANAIGAGANTTVIGGSGMTDVYFGPAAGLANIHASTIFLGSSTTPGCIVMGDSDGSGVTYLIVNNGVLTASVTEPFVCR